MEKRVLTNHYDLAGNGILRTMKLSLFGKFIPIGNMYGGPGARCLLVIAFLHWFGKPFYLAIAKYGEKLGFLRRRLRRKAQ